MLSATISHYNDESDPWFIQKDRDVAIADVVRKVVMFLGTRVDGTFAPRATAFLATYLENGYQFEHLVTAEHVVSGLLSQGHEIWARMNLKDGTAGEFKIDHTEFRYHPNNEIEPTDVAVCPITSTLRQEETGKVVEMDLATVPLNGPNSLIVTDELIAAHKAGIGDEIAIVGLFRSHFGRSQNVPIVRIGNISAMRGEPVLTEYAGYIDAYLVEARSIGGLSGLPVFLRFPPHKNTGNQPLRLLGMMHGHFDVQNLNEDVVIDKETDTTTGIHTGIGIVVPVHKIIETIQHPELIAMRKARAIKLNQRGGGAIPDVLPSEESSRPASDENPKHLEDFTRLVDVAARKRPQDDQT